MEPNKVTILPDEIGFSQDNIDNKFSKAFECKPIGEVLDDICNKKMSVENFLKNMKVGKYKNKSGWYTVNNRSLWVLKQLRLNAIIGENKKVCFAVQDIESKRFTTHDDGKTIVVRKKPVGGKKAKRDPYWRYRNETWDGKPANTVQFRHGRPLLKGGAPVAEVEAQALSGGGALIDYDSDGYDSDEYYE